MKKIYIIALLAIIGILIAGGLAMGAAPADFRTTTSSQTVVSNFTGAPSVSYAIYRSTDGITFNQLSSYTTGAAGASGTPVTGWTEDPNTKALSYTDTTVANYSNYYYYIQNNTDAPATKTYTLPAFPPTQTAHGSYGKDTDACASCHNTHSALGARLLKAATVNATCKTCHNGTGSKYNVSDGTVVVSNGAGGTTTKGSPAGPFGAQDGYVYSAVYAVTSNHSIGSVTINKAPGGNYGGASVGWTDTLTCASCHDPHATSHNYRALLGSKLDSVSIAVYGYATSVVNADEVATYVYGMNTFCSACHKDFNVGSGSGSTSPAKTYSTTQGGYRHAVGIAPSTKGYTTTFPLEGTNRNNNDIVICLTCHRAHGTTATGTNQSAYDQNGDSIVNSADVTTALKRANNMTICEDCHKK